MNDRSAVWVIHAGRSGEAEVPFNRGYVAIAWEQLGNLMAIPASIPAFKDALAAKIPELRGGTQTRHAGELFRFVYDIQIGDVVVFPSKLTGLVSLGRVLGPYQYIAEFYPFTNVRPVQWLRKFPRSHFSQQVLKEFDQRMTVIQVKQNDDEVRALLSDAVTPIPDQLTVSHEPETIGNVVLEQNKVGADAAGEWPEDDPEVADARDSVAVQAGRKPSGQGFRTNAEQRKAIEQYAVEMAITHYEAQGWTVKNVGLYESYDLHCSRLNGDELHVEVKGTTGMGEKVLLTPNEVRHAHEQYPNVSLFVVSNIVLLSEDGQSHASGGEPVLYEPWNLDDESLTAIGYEYAVPRAGRV